MDKNSNTSKNSKLDITTTKVLDTSTTSVSSRKKEGLLYKRSDHLKQWRKRYFSCDHNFLKISHDASGKNLRIIDLNNYTPSWQGKKKDKYVFYFKVRPELKLKPKSIILSSSDEGLAKDWFKFFLSVMDMNALLSGQTHIMNEIGSRARSQSQERGDDLDISDLNLSTSPNRTDQTFPDIPQQGSKRRSISVGAKNKKEDTHSSMASDISSIDIDSKADLTITESSGFSNRVSEAGNNNFGTSQFLVDRLESNKTAGVIKKTTVKKNGVVVEFILPKEAPKWVEQLFDKYIKGKEMWKAPTREKIDRDEWNIIQDNGQFRIMQSEKKSNVFKCLYSLENGSAEKLLQVLLDVQNKNKWDTSFGKAALLSYMPSTKQCVIHQVNKPFGMFYFPREFIYSRYVFKALGAYFIIDKSLQDSDQVKKSLKCPRGEIFYSIMQIKKEGSEVYLSVLLNITHGGLVSSTQDTQITLHSLMNLNNIPKIMNQYDEWDDFELAFMPSAENENEDRSWAKQSVAMDVMRFSVAKMPQQELENNIEIENLDADEIKVQNPLESSNLDLENEGGKAKPGSDEESKDEDLSGLLSPIKGKKASEDIIAKDDFKLNEVIVESTNGMDLTLLLEKVRKELPTVECIDKNYPKKKLTYEQMTAVIPDEENDLLNGKTWKRDPANGLRFIDEEFLNKQKKVLGHFLRSMGKNFLEGKSIMNVSLPITIFSGESMLQRCSSSFGYAVPLFELAGKQTDRVEAFKYAAAAFFSNGILGIAQSKPFNPIIGETYQGYLNGIPIVSEQISHHPPISAIHMKTDDFFLHGFQQLEASLGPNSATASDKRRLCLTLPKLDMNIYAYFPTALVSGTTFGKRYFNWSKKLKVYDPKHNLYTEILYNPDDKGMISNLFAKKTLDADKAKGSIYKVSAEYMSVMHRHESTINNDAKAKFNPKEHALEELSQADGCWTSYLDFDGKRYWDIEKTKPYKLIDEPNKALPSDSNLREDLIYKKMGDLDKGQDAKVRMENSQRADRKLREKTGGKSKH